MLASRLIGGYHKNLGRETFIAPVVWEDGWPVISYGTGKIEWSYPAPELPEFTPKTIPVRDDFDSEKLSMVWSFIGTPYEDFYSLKDSCLTLKLLPREMTPELKAVDRSMRMKEDKKVTNLSFIGRRQLDESFCVFVKMNFTALSENETAGLAIIQASNHQFRFERSMENGKQILRLLQVTCELKGRPWMPGFEARTTQKELAKAEVKSGDIYLKITAHEQAHSFYYGGSETMLEALYENADGGLINPEGFGMVGTMIGMYGSSNGQISENKVSFDWFDYTRME
jgi:alpha-N-arabinofuranosidase